MRYGTRVRRKGGRECAGVDEPSRRRSYAAVGEGDGPAGERAALAGVDGIAGRDVPGRGTTPRHPLEAYLRFPSMGDVMPT